MGNDSQKLVVVVVMMMMKVMMMTVQYSVTLPYLSHFTEGQAKEGSVRLHDLIKIREGKDGMSSES